MDRKLFAEKIQNASPDVSLHEMDRIITESIRSLPENREGAYNLVTVIEEFLETGQEVSKFLRGHGNIMGLTEELADAVLAIRYTQRICGISDEMLRKAVNVKLERQKQRNAAE